jgi:hypothetical protein
VSKSSLFVIAVLTLFLTSVGLTAQQAGGAAPPAQNPPPQGGRGGGRGAPPGPPPTAQAQAPIDLTGYWVSVVTEDWRWRMLTPAKGDTASVPLNAEGQRVAGMWDLEKDKADGNLCRAFGAAGLLRLPLRIHITWQDANTLKLETDSGQQTRLFLFTPQPDPPASDVAGTFHRPVVQADAARGSGLWRTRWLARGRQPAGDDDEYARRVSAKERRSLQRRRSVDRVLQSPRRTER